MRALNRFRLHGLLGFSKIDRLVTPRPENGFEAIVEPPVQIVLRQSICLQIPLVAAARDAKIDPAVRENVESGDFLRQANWMV